MRQPGSRQQDGSGLSRRRSLWGTLRQLLTLLISAAAAVGLLLLGWGAVRNQQTASAHQTQQEATVTARVESGTLTDEAQATAVSVLTQKEAVTLPAKDGARFTSDGLATGAEAGLGQILAEVNERPVIVFQGEVAAYRTLAKGAVGRDVAQLQRSLAALGYESGLSLGSFDESTGRGLAQLFRDLGYAALTSEGTPIPAGKPGGNAALILGEGYFAPMLPVKVARSCGLNRHTVSGPLCEVTTGAPALIAQVPTADAQRLKGQESIRVVFPDGKAYEGTLNGPVAAVSEDAQAPSSSSDASGADAAGAPDPASSTAPGPDPSADSSAARQYAVVLKGAPELPAPGSGEMPMTVVFAQSDTDALLVPSTAIRTASGTSWVQKENGARVDVSVGLCVQGRCAVTPVSSTAQAGGGLGAGESVVITGADQAGAQ